MEIIVVGDSIAALVALEKLRGNQGSHITWVQESDGPSGIWGGFKHAACMCKQHLGCVLFGKQPTRRLVVKSCS